MIDTDRIPEACKGELAGKIALVTGASRGIGRGIAKKLASLGAMVLVNYNGSEQKAREAAEEIRSAGGQAECVGCDVSDFTACGSMVEQIIGKYGRVDILVNNAGVTRDNLLMRMSEEDYDKVLDINLKGAFNTMRHLSRYFLKQRSGKVVNISSVSGVLGNAGQANYSASKAGLIGLTKSAARGIGFPGSLRQCGGSRIHRHGNDPGPVRESQGIRRGCRTHGQDGQRGGHCGDGGLSGRK